MTDPTEVLEDELRTALRLLAGADDAAPGADLARARDRGRRAIRRRRAARIAAPLTAAAVAVAGVSLALPDRPETVAPAQTRQQPSRWTVPVSFGWLPEGFTAALESERDGLYTMVARPSGPEEAPIHLTVYHERSVDRPWEWILEKKDETSPADPVGGRSAYWVTSRPRLAELHFQYAEDRWAQLVARRGGGASADPAALLGEVAARLDLTERPVALPFEITGLPADFWVLDGDITDPHDPARRKVSLSLRSGLRIEIVPGWTRDEPAPNTTVAGLPAYHFAGSGTRLEAVSGRRDEAPVDWQRLDRRQERLVGSERLCVYGFQGHDVCLSTEAQVPIDPTVDIDVVTPGPDWASELLKASGGLSGLLRRMTLIDGPVAKWSTAPFQE
ncbi:hypothetical protein [Actinocorallia populi]|uniref:hypothetical protein n=1 Tax=Actinocorallia populi TaxID=2079200 RepID=UPI000D0979D9|nr:hypothetical protein [Actinocorallia populi]